MGSQRCSRGLPPSHVSQLISRLTLSTDMCIVVGVERKGILVILQLVLLFVGRGMEIIWLDAPAAARQVVRSETLSPRLPPSVARVARFYDQTNDKPIQDFMFSRCLCKRESVSHEDRIGELSTRQHVNRRGREVGIKRRTYDMFDTRNFGFSSCIIPEFPTSSGVQILVVPTCRLPVPAISDFIPDCQSLWIMFGFPES